MKQYRHIVWDWNGTLLNDAWLFVEIMNSILDKYKMPSINLKKYRDTFEFPVINYYNNLGFNLNKIKFSKLSLEFISIYNKRMYEPILFKKSSELLKILSTLGYTHSILSAQYKKTLIKLIQFYKIDDYFVSIDGLDNQYANSKINMGIKWLNKVKYNPKDILMIGDTLHDYEVSQALGIDCILLSHGHNNKNRLVNTGANVFDDFSEFIDVFLKKHY
tara:strand:+ start:362 stop:1015 length:654 start_codon:yes stop_codon:yes gene_type:complete